MSDDDIVLPCPFCGSDDIASTFNADREADADFWWASCVNCNADGPPRPTEVECWLAWNTRQI